jgi:hypothetical protein
MAITTKRLRRLQAAQEVTKGTSVAATRALIVDSAAFDLAPVIYNPMQDIGLLANRHPGIEVQRAIGFSIDADLSFEDLPYWLNMALKKVTTGTGAGADKTWTFAPAAGGADDFMTFTFETRHSDGSNNLDRKYNYCMATKLTISGGLADAPKVKIEGFAKDEVSGAITGAISLPAAFTIPPSQMFKLTSDSSFANLGTTPITGQMYGWTIEIDTGLFPKFYDDGALTMSRHGRRTRQMTLTLTLDQEASAGFSEAIRTRLTSRALSYLRLQALGPALGGSNYTARFEGAFSVESVSPAGDHESEDFVTVKLISKYDTTGAQDIRAVVVNADAALT